jgi:hypothetical protein
MTLNAQMYPNYLRPTTFFEDLARPDTSGQYRSMDPFHFFENKLMREILLDSNESDDQETLFTSSGVSRPRLPYAKFSASSAKDLTRFLATRPNSHDVSDNDEQTSQAPAPPPVAVVVDMRARRPPGNLTVIVNRPVASFTGQQRAAPQQRRKLTMKRHMDRVFCAQYDERNENCVLSNRLRSMTSSNMVEFIMEP